MPVQQKQPQRKPDVIVGDEVYCHHPKGPHAGKVAAHGQHGVTLEGGHRVRWEHVLGHKRRARQEYQVEDQGEDGMIVKDRQGLRQYLAVPPEAREEKMMVKAHGQAPRVALLLKAAPPRDGAREEAGDVPRWVKHEEKSPRPKKGEHVGWVNGEHKGQGRVRSVGNDGLVAEDAAGGRHRVRHEHLTHRFFHEGDPPHGAHDAEAEARQAEKAKTEKM